MERRAVLALIAVLLLHGSLQAAKAMLPYRVPTGAFYGRTSPEYVARCAFLTSPPFIKTYTMEVWRCTRDGVWIRNGTS